MNDTYFDGLESSLSKASRLIKSIPPHQCNTELQSIRLESFILLSHSAIELYIESICRDAATEAVRRLTDTNEITRTLVSLTSSKIIDQAHRVSKRKIAEATVSDLPTFATEALTTFHNSVRKNNGIKSTNLDQMYLPVGVSPSSIDIAAYNALEAFGKKRGEIAHKYTGLTTEHTKTAIETELRTIKAGLQLYDVAVRDGLEHCIPSTATL